LTPTQRNYCTTRKELLAIVYFTRYFRHYLLGRNFLVRTDHGSLAWLMRFWNIGGQLARWLEELGQYDMSILHRAGRHHGNADVLSRTGDLEEACDCYRAGSDPTMLPCGGCNYCTRVHKQWQRFDDDVDDVVPLAVRAVDLSSSWVPSYSTTEIAAFQQEDPGCRPVLEWITSGEEPPQQQLWLTGPVAKELWNVRDLLELDPQGLLTYKWIDGVGTHHQCIVVPQVLKKEVLSTVHDLPSGGHYTHTIGLSCLVIANYMSRVALFVLCRSMHCVKVELPCGFIMLVHPWSGCTLIDILGPFPVSDSGNRYVLIHRPVH
jgi:hypothetical protein